MAELFLDTSFAIALSAPGDTHHFQAVQIADRLRNDKTRLVTTRAVFLEIGNALAKQRYREAAVRLLKSLESDSNVIIEPLSEELVRRGFELYSSRLDKDWGLIDCLSFVVMQDRGITEALTTDQHFSQAGFQALLSEK